MSTHITLNVFKELSFLFLPPFHEISLAKNRKKYILDAISHTKKNEVAKIQILTLLTRAELVQALYNTFTQFCSSLLTLFPQRQYHTLHAKFSFDV